MRIAWAIAALVWLAISSEVAFPAPAITTAGSAGDSPPSIAQRCSALKSLAVDGGRVVSARVVSRARAADASLDAASPQSSTPTKKDEPFCRVEASLAPTSDSNIKIEVWLPFDGDWNGKFFGTSNGGLEKIVYAELAGGLARGYATAAMDVVAESVGGPTTYRFAINHPELAENYAHRGIHAMTVASKQILTAFYKKEPAASIFGGCSGGGYEALGEATRYPSDYDGIIAGDPAINFANMGLAQGFKYVVSHRSASSAIPSSVLPMLASEVLAQCDSIDGLVDGIIDDPRRCAVNFHRLACKSGELLGCLQPDQIKTLGAIYSGLRDPRTGTLIYPGFPPGAELSGGAEIRISDKDTASFVNDETPGPLIWALGAEFRATNWLAFDFGADGDRYRAAIAPFENTNPDFGAFAARGGKLILYAGWGDSNLNPIDLVHYFEVVQSKAGGLSSARAFSRLFVAPGMYHCAGGPGPNAFGQQLSAAGSGPENDLIKAMDRWVTTGAAPERINATKFEDDKPTARIIRTRPLCAFPKVARWNGRGSISDATQFHCADP